MLPTHAELLQLIDEYMQRFPKESISANEFKDFVNRNLEKSVYSRQNFDGHFTASAFLVNRDKTQLLFLKHKKLNKWLQPGGHIDTSDTSILQAALREVEEETGLQRTDLQLIESDVFDLDAHAIPENPKKDEPAHVHYDVRYLLEVTNESNLLVNQDEAEGIKWLEINELEKLKGFTRIVKKLNQKHL